jgi:hypothetical protein
MRAHLAAAENELGARWWLLSSTAHGARLSLLGAVRQLGDARSAASMAGTPLDDSSTARTVALEFRPSRLTRRWLQNAELTSPLALCFRIRSSYSRHRPEQPRVGWEQRVKSRREGKESKQPSHLHHMVAAGETTSSGTLGSPLLCASTGVRLLASTSHRRISCCWARPSDNGEDVGVRRLVVNCAPRSVGSPPSVVSTFPSPKPPVPVCCFLVPASCT